MCFYIYVYICIYKIYIKAHKPVYILNINIKNNNVNLTLYNKFDLKIFDFNNSINNAK